MELKLKKEGKKLDLEEAKYYSSKFTIESKNILNKHELWYYKVPLAHWERWKKEKGFLEEDTKIDDLNKNIPEGFIYNVFLKIKTGLKKYIDTTEDNFNVLAIWIIGTYVHEVFSTYPYLFLNAMKGSGKSRTIKLITHLSNNGKLIMDLTDAVLFRTTRGRTLGIDEFENIQNKERQTLRTLLNSAYKKGVSVSRLKKIKSRDLKGEYGENLVEEQFELYAPIVMANINGVDDVLADRCITIIHEKSSHKRITRLIENFNDDELLIEIKNLFEMYKVQLVKLVQSKNIISEWNNYVEYRQSGTTQTTLYTLTTPEEIEIFEEIYNSNIQGRHLELFFPLFIIASLISKNFLIEFVRISKKIVDTRNKEDLTESRDVALIDFVSKQEQTLNFTSIKEFTDKFKNYLQEDEQEDRIGSKWVGKAILRLGLVMEKRRVGRGIEIILNVSKAKEKIKYYSLEDPGPIKDD